MTDAFTSPARSLGRLHGFIGSSGATIVLGSVITLAFSFHTALALVSPSIWIIPDELIYSELAKSLADGGLPRIRDEVSLEYGLAYPLLIAPAWALFADVETAYAAAKVINAFVLSLTAIPAYLLARRFVDERAALVVAVLTVSIPALLYAGTLMTEVALYPAVVLALLAMAMAIERPTRKTQLGALGAIGLAATVKTLALVLAPAYVAGVVLYQWLESHKTGDFRERMRRYAPTGVLVSAGSAAALGLAFAAGAEPHRLLGTYSSVWEHMEIGAVPRWALIHLAELDLAVAGIPVIASLLVVVRAFGQNANGSDRLFAALAVPTVAAWLVAVGAFASVPFLELFQYPENVSRLQGRSTFMLAPLLFLGLALWLDRRSSRWIVVLAVVPFCVLLPLAIPLDDLDRNDRFQAFSLVPWVDIRDVLPWQPVLLFVMGVLGAVVVLAQSGQVSAAFVTASVLTVYVIVGVTAHSSIRAASEWSRSVGVGAVPGWVDQAVGPGADVSVLWYEPSGRRFVNLQPRHRVLVVGEFFNRSVGDVYELGSPLPYALPSINVRLDRRGVLLSNGRATALSEHVLVPCHVRLTGTVVAHDSTTGARVLRVRPPIRVAVMRPSSCNRGVR